MNIFSWSSNVSMVLSLKRRIVLEFTGVKAREIFIEGAHLREITSLRCHVNENSYKSCNLIKHISFLLLGGTILILCFLKDVQTFSWLCLYYLYYSSFLHLFYSWKKIGSRGLIRSNPFFGDVISFTTLLREETVRWW